MALPANTVMNGYPKNKTALVIFASPHKDGNTANLLKHFAEKISDRYKTDFFNVYDINPLPCIDCGYCRENVGCSRHDLDSFMKKYENADVIVIASPVYNSSVPAPLKALMDRFQRYYNARFSLGMKPPIEKPKKAVLILTCGSNTKDGFEIVKRQFERIFTVLNTKLVSEYSVGGLDGKKISDKDIQNSQIAANCFMNE